MPSKLAGKTIILTGSSVVQPIAQLIEENGGEVLHFPLIETVELITPEDPQWLAQLQTYDWLIFTSQNAVTSFFSKCVRHQVVVPNHLKIAAVGEKTAARLQANGLQVDFMPTIFSADVFVQQFALAEGERALFLRGSLAKDTIRASIAVDEWTVYETKSCLKHLNDLEKALVQCEQPIVIFASPSAVDIYAKRIVPDLDWGYVKFASIGHVTTAALAKYGVTPIVQPKTYTMQAVIEQLILEETTND
jgi:uroporphyrinogen-III synthase